MIFKDQMFIHYHPKIFCFFHNIYFLSTNLKILVFLYYCFLCSKITILVFLVLREILLALSQWTIFFNSKFIFCLMSLRDLLEQSNFVSFTKWYISACFVTWWRSFINIKKGSGPETKRYGTPWLLVRVSDI